MMNVVKSGARRVWTWLPVVLGVSLLGTMTGALADGSYGPYYSYLQAGPARQMIGTVPGGSGFLFAGSYDTDEDVYLDAELSRYSYNTSGKSLTSGHAGIGGIINMTDSTDFTLGAAYVMDSTGGPTRKDGYLLNIGLRSMLKDWLELDTTVDYDHAIYTYGGRVGLYYLFTRAYEPGGWSVGVEYGRQLDNRNNTGFTQYQFTVRYAF